MSHDLDGGDPDNKHLAQTPRFERQESSPSTPEPSIYRQLSGSEIRLIRLFPGNWDDLISYELVYVPFDDQPKYVALSYAWGDAAETQQVVVNGHIYHITISLFTGLRCLRD
jgi:hypothetical protein